MYKRFPPSEHFETFTPENEYEKFLADKRIQEWQKSQDEAERRKELEEKNAGINRQVEARSKRLAKGVQH